ncbi:hypothetical protein BH09PAT2_BH09PAT2_03570 [soil metagenome]
MKKTNTCKFYIAGMHCPACEILIEKKLKKMPDVESAEVSLSDKSVNISYKQGHVLNIAQLNEAYHDLGYTFSEAPMGEGTITHSNVTQIVGIGIIFIVIYIILSDSNILQQFTLSSKSSFPAFFGLGIVASISSCAALAGGLLLSLSRQWNTLYGGKDESKRIYPVMMFNIGRLLSFALLGGILGYAGSFFHISLQYSALLVIIVSVLMFVLGLQILGVSWAKNIRLALPSFIGRYVSDEQNFQGKYMPFIVGALTFFLPCGFTLMAQSVALASGSFITGMLMMLVFALGTAPVLGIIGFSSVSFQKNLSLANSFNVIAAVCIVLFSIYNVNAQFNVLGLASMNDLFIRSNTTSNMELGVKLVGEGKNQYQAVSMEARGFEYFPKSLELKAGVPVKLTVKNNNVTGCAAAMYWPGLHNEMILLQGSKTEASFTPKEVGNYKVTCTMGMVPPVKVIVKK